MSTLLNTFQTIIASGNKDLLDDVKDYIFSDNEDRIEIKEELKEEIAIEDEQNHQLGQYRYSNTTDHSNEYKLSVFLQIDKHTRVHPILGTNCSAEEKNKYIINTLEDAVNQSKKATNQTPNNLAIYYAQQQSVKSI